MPDIKDILEMNAKKLEMYNKNNPLWNILITVDAILRAIENKED